jgi:hypothetical protein
MKPTKEHLEMLSEVLEFALLSADIALIKKGQTPAQCGTINNLTQVEINKIVALYNDLAIKFSKERLALRNVLYAVNHELESISNKQSRLFEVSEICQRHYKKEQLDNFS